MHTPLAGLQASNLVLQEQFAPLERSNFVESKVTECYGSQDSFPGPRLLALVAPRRDSGAARVADGPGDRLAGGRWH